MTPNDAKAKLLEAARAELREDHRIDEVTRKLLRMVEEDDALRRGILYPCLRDLVLNAQHLLRRAATRGLAVGKVAAARSSSRRGEERMRRSEVLLMDFPLPGQDNVRLRVATGEQVQLAARECARNAESNLRNQRWLNAIARKVPKDAVVEDRLNEAQVADLYARTAGRNS